MTIKEAKDELLNTMNSINKDKLSLPDLRLYAETLKVISEIQTKSYGEYMAEMMGSAVGGFGMRQATVSEMRGDA